MKKLIIAGNWKMHGSIGFTELFLTSLKANLKQHEQIRTLLFPPFVYLSAFKQLCHNSAIEYGAQNLSEYEQGAYTGEVSGHMLVDMGCQYTLIGHSERRMLYNETNEIVAKKFEAALDIGLKPIICVGESLAERESGQAFAMVKSQLDAIAPIINTSNINELIIAYEPVWAIGTGKTATPEQAQEIHGKISQYMAQLTAEADISVQILYGGSVKPENAEALFSMPDIHGGLIGGASLKVEQFLSIIEIAQKVTNSCNP